MPRIKIIFLNLIFYFLKLKKLAYSFVDLILIKCENVWKINPKPLTMQIARY